ncbi:MAG: alpha/beta hydrolase [Proteobacteria bacterium]|nr:alpha/beta hydrolase [Pseudomonadota bacterium]
MSLLIGIVVVYVGFIAAMYIFQRSFLYHPHSGVMDPAYYGLNAVERVEIVAADGIPLVAWYGKAQPGLPTLLYLHGNGGHIGHRAGKVKPYLDAGFSVLQLSYRGYGSNPGSPSEEGLYLDGRAAFDFLSDRKVPLFRTVIYGESLGSGVAVELAQDKGIAALVLEAPFASMTEMAANRFPFIPVRYLLKDRYESNSKIGKLRAPLLVIHGAKDAVVPLESGRALYDLAPGDKRIKVYDRAGHNDLYDFGAAQDVIEFLRAKAVLGGATQTE